MPPMRILLVDDHILFRKGLASLLDSQPDFEVIGEAGDGFEGLEKAKALKPDLVLMDVTMPKCSGPEATRLITQQMHGVQVVMLTVSDDDTDLFAAIRAGALGYLLKSMKPDELFTHLRGLAQGEAPISRLMASKLLREFARSSSEPPMPLVQTSTVLTDREQEVLNLIARGLTNREIGEELHIAENTVKNHVRSILDKLHLANRAQAAAYAVQVQMKQEQNL